jgi:cell division protein FtsB
LGVPCEDRLDWLALLILPFALIGFGLWFTAQQDQRQQQIENQRAEAERGLAEQSAQDAALQAYLDQMSSLLGQTFVEEVKFA